MQDENAQPVLSICIPTYNRSELVVALAESILSVQGHFELCIHIDGSVDDTLARLQAIRDDRLSISRSDNRGRPNAIRTSVGRARGRFIMIYDDDDLLYEQGLAAILSDCSENPGEQVCGYIYHMESSAGVRIGSPFNNRYSNFLKLRADEKVQGDKKEVVKGELLRDTTGRWFSGHRRIPTSMLWSLIALDHDVVCSHMIVGRKNYLTDGMTSNIVNLKRVNARPLVRLHLVQSLGYLKGRYQSKYFLIRSMSAAVYYSMLTVFNAVTLLWKRPGDV